MDAIGKGLVLQPDGTAKLEIIKPPAVVEAERQQLLAKQRMHRQVALEMYRERVHVFTGHATREDHEALIDECIDLAAYLIEKTGGHQ